MGDDHTGLIQATCEIRAYIDTITQPQSMIRLAETESQKLQRKAVKQRSLHEKFVKIVCLNIFVCILQQ